MNVKTEAFSPIHLKSNLDSQSQKDEENEEDDEDDSGSEGGSDHESENSNKKRGKYKVYTETEKSTILNFVREKSFGRI